jgi:hypothetical protein
MHENKFGQKVVARLADTAGLNFGELGAAFSSFIL